MTFNSISYIVFLVIFVIYFWFIKSNRRIYALLGASILFYGLWHPSFLLVMFISSFIDYVCAIYIQNSNSKQKRFNLLLLSIAVNLAMLFYFKYLNFARENGFALLNYLNFEMHYEALEIILPLGISFYTFEAISYIVDVYRGTIRAEKSYVNYAAFITFFPKLIAGPVLRAGDLLPQFEKRNRIDSNTIFTGLYRILAGLFLKVCLADNIAPFVDDIFAMDPNNLSAIDVMTAAFLFGFQIYFDFSGYSSIAIGSALLIGIRLPENFSYPYSSSSPKSFWGNWNISLSSWIRDYIYIPFNSSGKDKKSKIQINSYVALLLTWSIMGLWHGASWTFLAWGIYHGLLIALARILPKFKIADHKQNLLSTITIPITTLFIMIGWIPFRATSLNQVQVMWSKLFNIYEYQHLNLRENSYLIAAVMLILCWLSKFLHTKYLENKINGKTINIFIFISIFIMTISVFVFLKPVSQYIYFQF